MTNYKLKNLHSAGFTLIEVLIASMIFVMVVTVAIAAFGTSTGAQIQVDTARTVSESARFSIEEISRQVKLAASWEDFNHSFQPAFKIIPVGVKKELQIDQVQRNSSGEISKIIRRTYYLDDSDSIIKVKVKETTNLGKNWSGEIVSSLSSASQAKVTSLIFTGQGPTFPTDTVTAQPYVTIEMAVENPQGAIKLSEKANIKLRTTITSRDYGFKDIQGVKIVK